MKTGYTHADLAFSVMCAIVAAMLFTKGSYEGMLGGVGWLFNIVAGYFVVTFRTLTSQGLQAQRELLDMLERNTASERAFLDRIKSGIK